MTLEEAKKKILDEKILPRIDRIFDYEEFWVFHCAETDEADDSPPAIRKDDGSLFCFFVPDYPPNLKYTVIKE